MRVCILMTWAGSLDFFHRGMLEHLRENGVDIVCIAGPNPADCHERIRQRGFTSLALPIYRQPSPIKDLYSLIRLSWFFLWHRFDVIHVGTPKASLLGSIAARLTFHRRVLCVCHGRTYENATGRKRTFFNFIEKVISTCSTTCWTVCKELGQNMVKEKLWPASKIRTLGHGTCNGTDSKRFTLTDELQAQGLQFREENKIPKQATVLLFAGRIRFDKGIVELVDAFVLAAQPNTILLIVGSFETASALPQKTIDTIQSNPSICVVPFMADLEVAYAAPDIFILPSHREGFPLVPMEAASMELPVIASDISGSREAVVHGKTGLLVPTQSPAELAQAITELVADEPRRLAMGKAGRERILRDFQPSEIWNQLLALYDELAPNKRS